MPSTATPRHHPARRPVVAALAVGAVLALAACGSSGSTVDVTSGPSISPDKSAPPAPVVPAVWPLTGVAAGDIVSRPSLTVKIENSIDARPQTGLDQADMVWEEVVEGGITRFAATFNSAVPDKVGPIRSVRPMDAGITAPMHGLIAFSGGQAGFVNTIKAAGAQIISQDQGAKGFARVKDRKAPHNVYGTPATFWSLADADHSAAPAPQFTFASSAAAATAPVSGTPATKVDLHMSGTSHPVWTWSAAGNVFLRAEGTTPSVTAAGAQLQATNIVVLRVNLVNTGTVDPAGNPVPETVLVASGDAIVLAGGKQVAATWAKKSNAEPVKLTSAAGAPITLAPGNTWIELVPLSSGSVAIS